MHIRKIGKTIWERSRYVLVAAIFLFLQQFQQSASLYPIKPLLLMDLSWVLLNMAIVSIPFLILLCIIRRLDIVAITTSVVFTLLSLINCHVMSYHGAPFFAEDIFSIGTALNVAGGYKYLVNIHTNIAIFIFLMEVLLWLFLKRKEAWFCHKYSGKIFTIPLLTNLIVVYVCLFSPMTLFPQNLISWSWVEAVIEYGYGITLCNSAYSMTHMVSVPEDYHADKIAAEPASVGNGNRPDFFIILNESLCDINKYADIPESEALFHTMAEIPEVISGYAVCPSAGGGTNDTEYELLTSNDTVLLNLSAPFSGMRMRNANSLVSYLNQLEYTTIGMHCGTSSNYARNRAYPELGFDQVVLGTDSFKYREGYGVRRWLDSENYQDMLERYDACDEKPRMVYLLTFQNHGGYEQNDAFFDTIHVQGDQFGDLTDDLNEFLSSVEKSVTAFAQLISELKSRNRPVVLLMVGDHAPSFINNLQPLEGLNSIEQKIAARTVPYYIWSNIPLDHTVLSKDTSMTDLVPMLLKASGMPTSMYYETILKMNETIPVRVGSQYYMDANADVGELSQNADYHELMKNYFYMEYNNIMQGDDYNPLWFQPANP